LRMISMFEEATAFNQYLRGWNVSQVVGTPPINFNYGSALANTPGNNPIWP